VPDLGWAAFDAPSAKPLTAEEREGLQGIYRTGEAADDFGEEAAAHWSYVVNGKDTAHYLSFFCVEDVRYFIMQAKKNDTAILLNGYWRNVENTKTGKAQFTVSLTEFNGGGAAAAGQIQLSLGISGVYDFGDAEPEKKISFRYDRPLNKETPYLIVAHRGGGRNNDLLPASENSLEMIPLAAQLGANGIEIDVKLTKDGIPVLYHDERINNRLTNKPLIHGNINTYTFSELQQDIELMRGGKIPSLESALETVLFRTPLEFVWLDCKYKGNLEPVRKLQQQFAEKAKAMGKPLEIVIGVPSEETLQSFKQLSNYTTIPSLCELDTTITFQINANIWAPSWTKGHQDAEVSAVQKRGKKSIVWTVDIPDKIKEFMYEAKFNGLVTNRPTMAAYYRLARR
jgi:glycerophosphoryl diester phosphodiesterase